MAFVDPTTPNQADFNTFVYNQGVTTDQLPSDSDYLTWAFQYGVNLTNYVDGLPVPTYPLACYNAGFHYLLRITPDQPGQTFFADNRTKYNLLTFVAGAVTSSGDQGTQDTLSGSEGLSNLSLLGMDMLKTPWGNEWLFYSQAYGPTVIGLT